MALPQDQAKAVAIRRLAIMLCLITVLVVGATIASLLTGRWGWAAANGALAVSGALWTRWVIREVSSGGL